MQIKVFSEDSNSFLKIEVNKSGKKSIGSCDITPLFSKNKLIGIRVDDRIMYNLDNEDNTNTMRINYQEFLELMILVEQETFVQFD